MRDKALTGREGSGEGSDTPNRWGTLGRQRDAQGVPLSEFRDEKLPADEARAQEFISKAQEVLDSGVLGLSKTPPPIVQVFAAGSVGALNAQGGAKIGAGKSARDC